MTKENRIIFLKEALKRFEEIKFLESTKLIIEALKETIEEFEKTKGDKS